VLGASGIGKHHAKWWALEGATVCAFLGSSSESVAGTARLLADMFGFAGHGYTSLDDLLDAERPEIVDVCTPPASHAAHVQAALVAGAHVLCEKPFVFEEGVVAGTLLAQAEKLVATASAVGRRLGLCTQYAMAAAECLAVLRAQHPDMAVTQFCGHIASPARGRPEVPAETWVDLGPHMLGALQAGAPGVDIHWDSLVTTFAGYRAEAVFTAALPDGSAIDCRLTTDRTTGEPRNIRQLELNGVRFDIEGANDPNGVFQAHYVSGAGTVVRPDMMRLTIREFLNGRALVDGPAAAQNLAWLLRIRDAAS